MKKALLIIAFILIVATGYIYKFQPQVWQAILNESNSALQDTINNSDLLPPPLRSALDQANAHLTVAGTIERTNQQREIAGLLPLNENPKLDQAAELKLKDMFDDQYFEHISPSGDGPSDLANEVGYKYIMVGENLALGNFKDDQTLVQAWMDSPGHRANILNDRYQEIGVAVGKGLFEGKETWLAVQEFGTPLSACPQPSASLKAQINTNQARISSLQADLAAKKADLEKNNYSRQEYNRKVEAYNSEVAEVNSLISQTKALVNQYNSQVQEFNKCLEG
jgi:uncharacterized protein YkwD